MNDDELLRYSRHILLPQVDLSGQKAICESHVLVIGLGGLGSPVALYLAAAGVGKLTLVDHDLVELSNLQRQIAHGVDSVERSKVASAASQITKINPNIDVDQIEKECDQQLLSRLLPEVDVVVDCSDNVKLRYGLNRECQKYRVPWVSGAAIGLSGQVAVFDPRDASIPCYACMYPELSDEQLTCSDEGVLSPLVGVIGSLQAVEVLRILVGFGDSQAGKLVVWDAIAANWQTLSLCKDDNCDECLR